MLFRDHPHWLQGNTWCSHFLNLYLSTTNKEIQYINAASRLIPLEVKYMLNMDSSVLVRSWEPGNEDGPDHPYPYALSVQTLLSPSPFYNSKGKGSPSQESHCSYSFWNTTWRVFIFFNLKELLLPSSPTSVNLWTGSTESSTRERQFAVLESLHVCRVFLCF